MFENWKLGKWMDKAYRVACEWYPDEEEANREWILDQMIGLNENSTFFDAILALLCNDGEWHRFGHHDNCDYPDPYHPEDCVACHLIAEFEQMVIKSKRNIMEALRDTLNVP